MNKPHLSPRQLRLARRAYRRRCQHWCRHGVPGDLPCRGEGDLLIPYYRHWKNGVRRIIHEIQLIEVSLVTYPANPEALVWSSLSIGGQIVGHTWL
jgi:hypothetical protein